MSAGAGLRLVEELLNTLDERTFLRHGTAHEAEDRLTSTQTLEAWFGEHHLPASATPDDLEAARSLRAGLRSALLATRSLPELDERPRGGRRPESAGDVLAAFPVRLRAEEGGLRLVAATGSAGLDPVVEVVATAVADGSWRRLKLCASDDCHWAFVDTSRSGGGRWCSMETCGNRHKTRAYRQRQAG